MIIELSNITKKYGSADNRDALKGASLRIDKKEMIFIVGRSGSGKSTLLNIIAGLDRPTVGKVLYDAEDTADFSEEKWDAYRNCTMGFVFQDYNLYPNMTVAENVLLAMEIREIGKEEKENRLLSVLKSCDILEYKDRKVTDISGGERQRVAIARALVKNPEIILADEPTGNLDSENSDLIFQQLKEISKIHTVIVVSHDVWAAEKYADRIITIRDGVIEKDEEKRTDSPVIVAGNATESKNNAKVASLSTKEVIKIARANLSKKRIKLISLIIIFSLINTILFTFISVIFGNYGNRISQYLHRYGDFIEVIAYESNGTEEMDERKSFGVNVIEKLKSSGNENNLTYYLGEQQISVYDFETTFGVGHLGEDKTEKNRLFVGIYIFQNSEYASGEIEGKFPQNSNEVVVTDYIVDQLGGRIKVGSKVYVNWQEMTVSGIKKTNTEYVGYESENKQYYTDYNLTVCYVNDSYVDDLKKNTISERKVIALPSSDFSLCNFRKSYIRSTLNYGDAGSLINSELLSGRLPEKANEVVIAKSYYDELIRLITFEGNKIPIREINDYKKEDTIWYFDVAKYLSKEVEICGIAEDGEASVYVYSETFEQMVKDYYEYYWFEECGFIGASISRELVNLLDKQGFRWGNPDVGNMYDIRENIEVFAPIIKIVSVLLLLVSLALIVAFVFQTERDNRKEIAILRAVGVTRNDIAKVFYCETNFICILSLVIGVIGCYVFYGYLHTLFEDKNIWNNYYHVLTPNVFVILLLLIVIWLLFTIAILGPVRITTRKKPVEILRTL